MSLRPPVAPSVSAAQPRAFAGILRRPLAAQPLAALLTLAFAFGASACSDDGEGSGKQKVDPSVAAGLEPGQLNTFDSVNTVIAETGKAGVQVQVQCVAGPGDVVIPNPTFTVLPSDDVTIEKGGNGFGLWTTKKPGSYTVTCSLNNKAKTVDISPSVIQIGAGPATTVTTTVEPSKVPAGSKAKITCSGADQFGNPVGQSGGTFTATATPAEIGTIADLQITGKKAGAGEVKCSFDDSAPEVQVTPAAFEVTVGEAAKTTATVTPDKIVAGEGSAKITCTAEDAYGNTLTGQTFTYEVPAGLTLTGDTITSSLAGKYEVKCVLGAAADKTAGKLEVTPAEAISIKLGAEPTLKTYKIDDTVKLVRLGTDKFGNVGKTPITDPVAVDLPDAVTVNGNGKSYSFRVDGYVTFTYTDKVLKNPDGSAVTASLKVLVDSVGPLVYYSSPKRGETLDGSADIQITGTIADEWSKITKFEINGEAVDFGADGSFSVPMTAKLGMNPIMWKAEDDAGNISEGIQTFYYSTKYYPDDVAKPNDAKVGKAIALWLSQGALDAGPPHDHKAPKDFATIFELVLGTLDFSSLLGSAGVPFDLLGIKAGLQIKELKLGDPSVNSGYPQVGLTVVPGGLNIKGKINNFSATASLVITSPIPGFQDIVITGDWLSIEMDLFLKLDPATKQVTAEAKNTKVKIQNLKIQLGGNNLPGWLQSIVVGGTNLIINFVDQFLNGIFTGLIEQLIQSQVQSLLGDTLGSALSQLNINTDLPLGPFIGDGDPVVLKLGLSIGLLDFVPTATQQGGILIGLDGGVLAEKKVPYAVKGALARVGCLDPTKPDTFVSGLKYAIEAGLAEDFAGELLHALWNGGGLALNIGESVLGGTDLSSFGVSNLAVTTDFLLPPIINTCYAPKGSLRAQIGDVGINAKLNFSGTPVDVDLFASLEATAEIKAVVNPTTGGTELSFGLKGIDFLEMEIVKINEEAKFLKDTFKNLIKGILVPQLTGSLGNLGSFPIPEIDLSTLSPAIPAGTLLKLDIQSIEPSGGYVYLRGKLK